MSKELDNLVFLHSEDTDKEYCPHAVHNGGRSVGHHQCERKGKDEYAYTYEGKKYKFCKAHFPANINKRSEERLAKWSKEYEERLDGYARERAMKELATLSVKLLPSIEWDKGVCPVCDAEQGDGHTKVCKMAKALKLVRKIK